MNVNDGPSLSWTPINANSGAGADNTIVAGVAGKSILVWKIMLVLGATASAITVKDGAATALTGPLSLVANGSMTLPFDAAPWFKTSPGNAFILNSGAAVQLSGLVGYTFSPANIQP